MQISPAAARAHLDRDRYHNLMFLGALDFEIVRSISAVERDGALAALALVVEQHGPLPDAWPTVMVTADDADALMALLESFERPARAAWSTHQPELLPILEDRLGRPRDPLRGLLYYIVERPPRRPHRLVRRITASDADVLDLEPCSLSPTALRNWLKRGWRIFGVVESGRLLSHALAAYPIGDTEEVAAVYTAQQARGQGLASAVVAAAIDDILARDHRAIYATTRTNIASQNVAKGLGLAPLFETWDILTSERRAPSRR